VSVGSTNLRAAAFCDRDLEINPMTLKLQGDLDILTMYLHTENEAVCLRHQNSELRLKKRKDVSRSKGQDHNAKSSELLRELV